MNRTPTKRLRCVQYGATYNTADVRADASWLGAALADPPISSARPLPGLAEMRTCTRAAHHRLSTSTLRTRASLVFWRVCQSPRASELVCTLPLFSLSENRKRSPSLCGAFAAMRLPLGHNYHLLAVVTVSSSPGRPLPTSTASQVRGFPTRPPPRRGLLAPHGPSVAAELEHRAVHRRSLRDRAQLCQTRGAGK